MTQRLAAIVQKLSKLSEKEQDRAAELLERYISSPEELPNLSTLIGKGKGLFSDRREADHYIRSERDAWD